MQRVSKLIGKAIVGAHRGERVGTVSDVLLDVSSQQVLGLVIGGGLLASEHVLPFEEVQTLGIDAVVARSADRVVDPQEWRRRIPEYTRTSALTHRPVLTTSGRALGTVRDVVLGDAGNVEALDIVGSTLGALLRRRSTVPHQGVVIGTDAVLVPEHAVAELEWARRPVDE